MLFQISHSVSQHPQILPGQLFLPRAAQQIGRMQCRQEGDHLALTGIEFMPATPQFQDAFIGGQEGFCRRAAQCHNRFRFHQLNLTLDDRQKKGGFLWCGGAVAWWSPEQDIGDVNTGPVKAD